MQRIVSVRAVVFLVTMTVMHYAFPAFADNTVLDKTCYVKCLKDGNYSSVCHNICATKPLPNRTKLSGEQYECYNACIDKGGTSVSCMKECEGDILNQLKQRRREPAIPGIDIR